MHHIGSAAYLLHRVRCRHDAAHADDGVASTQRRAQLGDYPVAGFAHRRARETTGFLAVLHPLHRGAGERRVGGHHAIHALALQGAGNHVNLGFVQIRSNLDKDGHPFAVLALQRLASLGNGT